MLTLIAAIILGQTRAESARQLAAGTHLVARVVDGDTIVVLVDGKQRKVRLVGVDTPETVHPSKPVERFGREASDWTKKRLQGKRVRLEYDLQGDRVDRYGRLLAYVYLGDVLVNREIIEKGYGFAYTKYPHGKLNEFRLAEQHARKAKRGLWGEDK